MKYCRWMLFCLSLMVISGCEASGPSASQPGAESGTESSSEEAKPESTEVESTPETEGASVPVPSESSKEPDKAKSWNKDGVALQIANWDEVQAKVKASKGKVVVLDVWSSWCLPCVRELPGLIELQKKYPDQVVTITVNVNYNGGSPPEDEAEEVLGQLAKLKAISTNYLSSTADEELYEKLDLASIPVAYVYNPDGSLNKRFDNETQAYGEEGFTYQDHITPLVDELLKKK